MRNLVYNHSALDRIKRVYVEGVYDLHKIENVDLKDNQVINFDADVVDVKSINKCCYALNYRKNKLDYCLLIIDNVYYVAKLNENYLALQKFKRKSKKEASYTKKELIEILKNNKDSVLIKRDYRYTDDYAYDYASNYGETEYGKINDIEYLLKKISYSNYTVSGSKEHKIINLYSNYESYTLKVQ